MNVSNKTDKNIWKWNFLFNVKLMMITMYIFRICLPKFVRALNVHHRRHMTVRPTIFEQFFEHFVPSPNRYTVQHQLHHRFLHNDPLIMGLRTTKYVQIKKMYNIVSNEFSATIYFIKCLHQLMDFITKSFSLMWFCEMKFVYKRILCTVARKSLLAFDLFETWKIKYK